jgi:dihydroceramidase
VTSSVDFCEPNYELTRYAAEPHNAWSSLLGLALPGAAGLLLGNPVNEWRFFLCHAVLFSVGIGSAALHATLHWLWQSSDELPMIYLVLAFLYAQAETDAPRGKAKRPWLAPSMWMVAVLNTAVYFSFQHLYWVFLATFSTGVALLIVGQIRLYQNVRSPEAHFFFRTGLVSYVLVGTPVWILDMLLCEQVVLPAAAAAAESSLLPGPCNGMTPHVLWHFAAGYGGYACALFLLCCRLDALGVSYRRDSWWGVFPIIVVVVDSKLKSP